MELFRLLKDKFARSLRPIEHEPMFFERRLAIAVSIEAEKTLSATDCAGWGRDAYFAAHAQTERKTDGRSEPAVSDSRKSLL